MKIYLIGMPMSGKSTIGKVLSERLKFSFVDLDYYIEETYNIFIDDLLLNGQVKEFRSLEEKALMSLMDEKDLVIATGGGIVLKETNYDLMTGIIVFLDVELKTIEERQKTTYQRPLLKKTSVKTLYNSRINKYYSFADLVIKETEVEKSVDEILKKLKEEGLI